MTTYDPQVIRQHAHRLYRQARSLPAAYGLAAFLVAGAALATVVSDRSQLGLYALLAATIGAYFGYQRGLDLKIRAQQALCAVATEENTRPPAKPEATRAPTAPDGAEASAG